MRCSKCMGVLVTRGDSVVCRSCGIVLDPQLEEAAGDEAPALLSHDRGQVEASKAPFVVKRIVVGLGSLLFMSAAGFAGWYFGSLPSEQNLLAPVSTIRAISSELILTADDEALPQGSETIEWKFNTLVPVNTQRNADFTVVGNSEAFGSGPEREIQYTAIEFDRHGSLRSTIPLGPIANGALKSVSGTISDTAVFAFQMPSKITFIARTADNNLSWRRDVAYAPENKFDAIVFPIDQNTLAIIPGERPNEMSVMLLGRDGYPIWQRQIQVRNQHDALISRNAFQELVIAHNSNAPSGEPGVALMSVSLDGQIVSQHMFRTEADQTLLAMETDDVGSVFLLFGGDAPELKSIDVFGDLISSILLPYEIQDHNCAISLNKELLQIGCASRTELLSATLEKIAPYALVDSIRRQTSVEFNNANVIAAPERFVGYNLVDEARQKAFFMSTELRQIDRDEASSLSQFTLPSKANGPTEATRDTLIASETVMAPSPAPDDVKQDLDVSTNPQPVLPPAPAPSIAQEPEAESTVIQIIPDLNYSYLTCRVTCTEVDDPDVSFVVTKQRLIGENETPDLAVRLYQNDVTLSATSTCSAIDAAPRKSDPVECELTP